MWRSTKWTINESNLMCVLRNTKNNKPKIINYNMDKIVIVDVPGPVGVIEDNIEMLKDLFQSSNVSFISNSYYKIICPRSSKIPSKDSLRNINVLKKSVYSFLLSRNTAYHSVFDGKFYLEQKSSIEYVPSVIFWDLEVEIPEDGSFPNSSKNPITMISLGTNNSRKVEVYTTLPKAYLNERPYIYFETELEMLEKFYMDIRDNDLEVGYWTTGFDMPYLVTRLNVLGSDIIEKNDDSVEYTFGSSWDKTPYETINFKTTDHLDLYTFIKLAYPELENHKLNTASKHFLGKEKVDVDIQDLKLLKNLPETPTPELQKLVNIFYDYSAQDTMLLKDMWTIFYPKIKKIVDTLSIPYSKIGTEDETDAFIFKYMPELSFEKNFKVCDRIPRSCSDPGLYCNVSYYNHVAPMLEAMIKSDHEATNDMGEKLNKYGSEWIVKDLFLHPKMHPIGLFKHDLVSVNSTGFYINFKLNSPQPAKTYFHFIQLSMSSWIALNEEKDQFTYNGISYACKHPFKLVKRGVETFIISYLNGVRDFTLKTYVRNIPFSDESELMMTKKITRMNYEKFLPLLNKAQISRLENDFDTWYKINYIMTADGMVSMDIYNQNKSSYSLNLNYYSNELYKILSSVYKAIRSNN